MRFFFRIVFVIILSTTYSFAQTGDAKTLVREGIELSNQKNYAAATEKYKVALAIDPDYAPGNYQMAFSLTSMGKGLDGISYLQKVFKSTTASANLIGGAYDLAGSIYDQARQPQKAIANYLDGIKTNPAYQPLRYNLALAYFRNKQYADAEAAAEQAIKADPKHASSMRLYALVTFHQNKRAQALLGFCSFLILEPNTARSTEAFGNMQRILQGGVLKLELGQKTSPAIIAMANAQNKVITKALTPFATRRYASAGDLMSAQLSAIFTALATMPHNKYYFWYDMADHFGKLAQSPNMPAFARMISSDKPESAKWIKDNAQQMVDLEAWLKSNAITFQQ